MIDRRRLLQLGGIHGGVALLAQGGLVAAQEGAEESKRGAMLLCGGGKLSDSILDTFCKLGRAAGNRMVLVPTASPRSDHEDYSPWLELWRGKGWREVSVVHAESRQEAMREGFGRELEGATAVWIGGGDQSRIVERYLGTVFLERLKGWWEVGGVVGGTSAGAAVMSRRMISGGEVEPEIREGFGWLPEVIVDQHFSEKKRLERLKRAVFKHPELVGVGIDEGTGWLIKGGSGTVIGSGRIHEVRYMVETSQFEVSERFGEIEVPHCR